MQSHLCDEDIGCFSGNNHGVNVGDCEKVHGQSSGDIALYLEGLSVLADKTQNSTLRQM